MNINNDPIIIVLDSIIRIINVSSVSIDIRYTVEKRTHKNKRIKMIGKGLCQQ